MHSEFKTAKNRTELQKLGKNNRDSKNAIVQN